MAGGFPQNLSWVAGTGAGATGIAAGGFLAGGPAPPLLHYLHLLLGFLLGFLLEAGPQGPEMPQKQRKCLHEHWKNCHDYPEAHTWEARDQKDIEEEEAVRALVAAEDDSYLAYEEACKVRQFVSTMIARGNTPDTGRRTITGRARVT
ncbi:hypothetical protein EI94DRAFT_1806238 [Lactarius quietus]|nr:hypothetical protein EI94DRAFT_1806238 [Lactarius quietus]